MLEILFGDNRLARNLRRLVHGVVTVFMGWLIWNTWTSGFQISYVVLVTVISSWNIVIFGSAALYGGFDNPFNYWLAKGIKRMVHRRR